VDVTLVPPGRHQRHIHWARVARNGRASETGLPICCHIGLNAQLESLARRDPAPQKGIFVPMVALSTAEPLGLWVLTGVLERFPELKIVFAGDRGRGYGRRHRRRARADPQR
jgi:predicted TIM-barrel fold metal-dependent hydrolase